MRGNKVIGRGREKVWMRCMFLIGVDGWMVVFFVEKWFKGGRGVGLGGRC